MAFAPQTLLPSDVIIACGTLGGSAADNVFTAGTGAVTCCLHVDVVTAATITVAIIPNGASSVALKSAYVLSAGDHLLIDGLSLSNGDEITVQSNQTDTTYFLLPSRTPVPSIQVTSNTGAIKTGLGTNNFSATYYFTGTPAATAQAFFVAPFACTLQNVSEVHGVAAGGTSTLKVTHETGTTAPGSGTDVLSADFNLNATANTPQNATLVAAQKPFVAGDRLSVNFVNAIQSSAGIVVTAMFSIP
jgi:hypothetical protein